MGGSVKFWLFLTLVAQIWTAEVFSTSSTCFESLSNYAICIENSTETILRNAVPVIGEIEKCLIDSTCTNTAMEPQKREQPQGVFARIHPMKLWFCADNASTECRTNTQQCIIENVPEWNDTKLNQEKAATLIKQPFHFIKYDWQNWHLPVNACIFSSKKMSSLKYVCPNQEAQNNASICINAALRNFAPPSGNQYDQRMVEMCSARNRCKNEIPTEECKKRLDDVLQLGCICFKNASLPITDHFLDCLELPTVNILRQILNPAPLFSKAISNEYCNAFDPCKSNNKTSVVKKIVTAGTGFFQKIMNATQFG